VLSFDSGVETKPRGYYFETSFSNKVHLHFKRTNMQYAWSRVSSFIYGVLYGRFWISNEGQIQIVNHTTNEVCLCKYYPPSSMFSKEPLNRVLGIIRDSNMLAKYVIEGYSSVEIYYSQVLNPQRITSLDGDVLSKLNLGKRTILWTQFEYR
jgi:hypothetical protein